MPSFDWYRLFVSYRTSIIYQKGILWQLGQIKLGRDATGYGQNDACKTKVNRRTSYLSTVVDKNELSGE